MEFTLSTPALLFPAVSLVMLAYTNRFFFVANLIRNLYTEYEKTREEKLIKQIYFLKNRLLMIRNMQIFGVLSLLFCVVSMFLLYLNNEKIGSLFFGFSLISLMISLAISIWEIQISINALFVELSDLEAKK
jgi:hypothetical protein